MAWDAAETETPLVLTSCSITANGSMVVGGGLASTGTIPPSLQACNVCDNAPDQIDGSFEDLGDNDICDDEPCPADFDGDGFVKGPDLGFLFSNWGPCPAPCPADFDGDGFDPNDTNSNNLVTGSSVSVVHNNATYDTTEKYWTLDGSTESNVTTGDLGFEGDVPHTVSMWVNASNLEANSLTQQLFNIGSGYDKALVRVDIAKSLQTPGTT